MVSVRVYSSIQPDSTMKVNWAPTYRTNLTSCGQSRHRTDGLLRYGTFRRATMDRVTEREEYPYLLVLNKADLLEKPDEVADKLEQQTGQHPLIVSAKEKQA